MMANEFLRGAKAQVYRLYDNDNSSLPSNVESLIRQILSQSKYDAIYTCGSQRLLMLIKNILEDFPNIKGEVATEQQMACGMGVCLSCVKMFDINGEKKFLRVCSDGPIFPIRSIIDEMNYG